MSEGAPRLDMSPAAISARLRRASELSDLDPARRLEGKLDMSPGAITRRLREASELLELCRALAAAEPPG